MVGGNAITVAELGYPITIGESLLDRAGEFVASWAPAHRFAVITDSHVGPIYAPRLEAALRTVNARVDVFTFPAGEDHKTRETWAVLTDQLISTGFGRDSSIVALGGGVVGDLAGFVAATFMRGIPVVQVPTTLAAMVDAAIGGKTGVDTPAGKNLVGAFHPPAGVLVDPQVLTTLHLREFQAGMAEVLKHGAIADASYFQEVTDALPELLGVDYGGAERLRRVIARSIDIKVAAVGPDVREAGIRKTLNFGHTIGHAVEAASGYALRHGEAVAIGMAVEVAAGEVEGVTEAGTTELLKNALTATGLPTVLPSGVTAEAVMTAARADKKRRAGELEFAIPRRIGVMAGEQTGWTVRLPERTIREVLT